MPGVVGHQHALQVLQRSRTFLDVSSKRGGIHVTPGSVDSREQRRQRLIRNIAPTGQMANGAQVLAALLLEPKWHNEPLIEQLGMTALRQTREVGVEKR